MCFYPLILLLFFSVQLEAKGCSNPQKSLKCQIKLDDKTDVARREGTMNRVLNLTELPTNLTVREEMSEHEANVVALYLNFNYQTTVFTEKSTSPSMWFPVKCIDEDIAAIKINGNWLEIVSSIELIASKTADVNLQKNAALYPKRYFLWTPELTF